ncbi:MAG: hypothetical protein KAT35_04245, partial [Candidatus Aenigmarchaeota archaeon]|nr:hypothetical protein [Candidatus Aenigmarchaeota archaeon]
ADLVRLYTGKEIGEISDKELKTVEKKLKTTSSCRSCGFCYQYNRDVSLLKSLDNLDNYNTYFVEVFCEDRYTLSRDGFKCDFEQRADTSFDLKKCPKCDGKLIFTAIAMKVSVSGLVESFCPKCGKLISSGRPFVKM